MKLRERMADYVNNKINNCRRCPNLNTTRRISMTILNGEPQNQKFTVVVGEAPGRTEFEKQCIFCGRSGQLLRKAMFDELGYRNLILINTIKCWPPENRTPTPEEISNCINHLQEQIQIIKEEIKDIQIFAAGRIAQRALTNLQIDHIPIYHPAFILRQGGSVETYKEHILEAVSQKAATTKSQETKQDTEQGSRPLPALHLHSDYSTGDSILKISQIIDWSKKYGLPACVTDHGSIAGLYELEQQSLQAGVDHILGYEAYIHYNTSDLGLNTYRTESDVGHLLILIDSAEGFSNLLFLHNEHSQHNKRTVIELHNLLQNCRGLVISTACIGGVIGQIFMRLGEAAALQAVKSLHEKVTAGGGKLYLELMPHDILETQSRPSQRKYNKFLERAHKVLQIPIIVTTDAHYEHATDKHLKIIASAAAYHNQQLLQDPNYFPGNTYHLDLSEEEIKKILLTQGLNIEVIDTAIRTTRELAASLAEHKRHYKIFQPVQREQMVEEFDQIVQEAWERFRAEICPDDTEEYRRRLKRETELIKQKQYTWYFLTLHKIIKAVRARKIHIGISRGSGGGSLVAFLLGITKLDPIKFGLLFERFLNEFRTDPPDIDIDVQMSRRDEMIQIIKEVVGRDRLAQITTYITFQEKNLQRDIAWLSGKSYQEAAFANTDISSYKKLLGVKKHRGVHASGFIIHDIASFPLMGRESSDIPCVELDLELLNLLGMEKYDFLGLTGLDIIYSIPDAEKHLIEAGIITPDGVFKHNIPSGLQQKVTQFMLEYPLDIFQIGTETCIPILEAVRPTTFEQLTHLISLNRPGPRDSGMVDDYISGDKISVAPKPLQQTRGCCIFQEQLIEILKDTFGLSLTEAEELRRIISKKKAAQLAKWEERLNPSSDKNKKLVWNSALNWAEYGFNKSHATGYAALSFISGYLKMLFPEEFYAAALNYETDEIMRRKLMKEARKMGIQFFKPQLNLIFSKSGGLGAFFEDESITAAKTLKQKILTVPPGHTFTFCWKGRKVVALGLNTVVSIGERLAEGIIDSLKKNKKLSSTTIRILNGAGFWSTRGGELMVPAVGTTGDIRALAPIYKGISSGRFTASETEEVDIQRDSKRDSIQTDTVYLYPHNGRYYCEDNDEIYECIAIPKTLAQKHNIIRAVRYKQYVIDKATYDAAPPGAVLYASGAQTSSKGNRYQRVLLKDGKSIKEYVHMLTDGITELKAGDIIKYYTEGDFIRYEARVQTWLQ